MPLAKRRSGFRPFVTRGLQCVGTHAAVVAAIAVLPLSGSAVAAEGTPVTRQISRIDSEIARGRFKADWASLQAYRVPEWFRDAKFGIFIHWGVYAVPAFGTEWYSRNMYVKGDPAFTYHQNVYGDQAKFGYKDFIPKFTAERFDPKAWIALFKRSGARYIVPVAEHCDGFAMYDSALTRWTSAKMGPKRDVVGEIAAATRAQGLHFGLSSHRAEHAWWYGQAPKDSDVFDTAYADLYGPAAARPMPGIADDVQPDPNHLEQWLPPSKAFLDDWLARTGEVVEKYNPEFVYLDWWINQPAFAPYLQRFSAYYYNAAARRGSGPVLAYKEDAFPAGTALFDVERGRLDTLRLLPWQTDTSISINSWGYVQNDHYRSAASLIGTLVDVVSKNGNLLLNVGPRADGTIPEPVVAVLDDIGQWLTVNGEAIYETRPWTLFGEGPTRAAAGSLKEGSDVAFVPADIRFTAKGDTLYAIGLARPADRTVLIRSLFAGNPYGGAVASVTLLGARVQPAWHQQRDGLQLTLPADAAADPAMPYALRITFDTPAARRPRVVALR